MTRPDTRTVRDKPKGTGLTDVVVPLWVQVCLVGETPLHDVEAVVVTGLDSRHGLAVGAVQHLGKSADAGWGTAHLQERGQEGQRDPVTRKTVPPILYWLQQRQSVNLALY